MALDTLSLLAAFAATILLGLAANHLFERFRLPDTIMLILLGVALGPWLGVLPPDAYFAVAPTLGTVALLLIMFDAGLSIQLRELVRGLARASYLALAGWAVGAVLVAISATALLGWDVRTGLLLGAVIGGSSGIIVIPAIKKLGASEEVRVTLSVESALTDVLCIVGTLAIAQIIASGTGSLTGFLGDVGYRFAVAAVVGFVAGAVWMFVWPKVESNAFAYMITLAVLLLLHVGVEAAHASGPIAVFAFGLTLGNEFSLTKGVRMAAWQMGGEMRRFHTEIVFFFRAFFFVGLGVLLDAAFVTDGALLQAALIFVAALVVARVAAVVIGSLGSEELSKGRPLMVLMLPRGLAAAVLATLPVVTSLPGTGQFLAFAFVTILATNAIAAFAPLAVKEEPEEPPSAPPPPAEPA
jgi:cell volume regulation protein A